jgi:L-lactate dehydrogenase (cytochrome)
MTITTIEDLRKLYQKRVPKMFYDYTVGGSWTESTLSANETELQKIKFRQRVGINIANRNVKTSVFGNDITMPVILSPVGMVGMQHADGEILAAQAAEEFGVPFCLSTMSICSIEQVAARTSKPFWFQLYVIRDKEFTQRLLDRAKKAGCTALVITLDCQISSQRHRDAKNGLAIPPKLTLSNICNIASKPRWALEMVTASSLTFGNIAGHAEGADSLTSISQWTNSQFDPGLTWEDVRWVMNRWDGKIIIKGIMDPEDARIAVEIGADAIVASNHGGRQLDGAPSTIEVLPDIVRVAGDEVEVWVDSGFRSGQDVLRALALGADKVMIGRPYVYGLGAMGKAGVTKALEIIKTELDLTMAFCGINDVNKVSSNILYQKDNK